MDIDLFKCNCILDNTYNSKAVYVCFDREFPVGSKVLIG